MLPDIMNINLVLENNIEISTMADLIPYSSSTLKVPVFCFDFHRISVSLYLCCILLLFYFTLSMMWHIFTFNVKA